MTNANINPIERLTFELTAAAAKAPFPFEAEFVRVLSADEEFDVAVNRSSYAFPIAVNGFFRMPRDENGQQLKFNHIEFRRKTGAVVVTNSIRVLIGSGDYETGSVALAATMSMAAGQTIRQTPAGTLNGGIADIAPVATGGANATALIAASTIALRWGVKVKNTGTVPLRIAGTDADAKSGTRGDYLGVSESCFYPVAGALYAAGVGGVGACAVTELLW